MAGIHAAPADIKLLAQTQLQIIAAACELEMDKKRKPQRSNLLLKTCLLCYFQLGYSQCL